MMNVCKECSQFTYDGKDNMGFCSYYKERVYSLSVACRYFNFVIF